jgi:hypothetical protein
MSRACRVQRSFIEPGSEADVSPKGGKVRLLSLAAKRTTSYKQVDAIAAAIEADLGGNLSAAEREIVEAATLLGAMWRDAGTRWLSGKRGSCHHQRPAPTP